MIKIKQIDFINIMRTQRARVSEYVDAILISNLEAMVENVDNELTFNELDYNFCKTMTQYYNRSDIDPIGLKCYEYIYCHVQAIKDKCDVSEVKPYGKNS